ncbi:MAG: Dam family site-specific DNA-(adenine-N6)-methyltransferase [Candidatus Izemoplasmatales bacterium]|jgi:DNA adenine methylase|nr:Dam family site-specific DNA-(adenine-N6)-methyltransferase [Candidatus Izemoplasmatales bacterium]
METSLLSLGNDIKNYRMQAGMSQEQLASICGVERSQLSRIESGEVLGVTYATIEKILNSLGRTIQHVKIEEKDEKLDIHPFVKWAGGKTQLLEMIEKHLPEKFNRYFEPFVGGGALLFKIQPKSFSINDMNSELICVYECFQNDGLFSSLKEKLIEHEKKHNEDYYYKVREEDKNPLFLALPKEDRASRMIYLNKSCFNGLYRVNSKGYFNVPFGKKDKVNCFDRDNFESLRQFFKSRKAVITNCDFEEAVKNAKAGDFVYFDPPYDTWDDKDSFTSYDKNAFGKDEQVRLANVYKQLSKKGVYVMLSNHNTSFIRELYSDFHINVIPAKRMINANGKGRGSVEEVLITNYE